MNQYQICHMQFFVILHRSNTVHYVICFLAKRIENQKRYYSPLSPGLGSGTPSLRADRSFLGIFQLSLTICPTGRNPREGSPTENPKGAPKNAWALLPQSPQTPPGQPLSTSTLVSKKILCQYTHRAVCRRHCLPIMAAGSSTALVQHCLKCTLPRGCVSLP